MYLGIRILANLNHTYKQNFTNVIAEIKINLNCWLDLSLSWMGRASLIKMNILSRFLYPMQMLPLHITQTRMYDNEKSFLSIYGAVRQRKNEHSTTSYKQRGDSSIKPSLL